MLAGSHSRCRLNCRPVNSNIEAIPATRLNPKLRDASEQLVQGEIRENPKARQDGQEHERHS